MWADVNMVVITTRGLPLKPIAIGMIIGMVKAVGGAPGRKEALL